MTHHSIDTRQRLALSVITLIAAATAAAAPNDARSPGRDTYAVRLLVSDGDPAAAHIDPNLVNPWGVARSAASPWWVANNETATSTLYDGNGNPQTLVVAVPGAPTGTVFNGGTQFVVSDGTRSAPARFLFASQDGTISGWSPSLVPNTQAFVAVDNSPDEAIYLGLAIANTAAGPRLYAADFHHARVDVYDGSFQPVVSKGAFTDPALPAGYAPFGIQELQGRIYVAYAKQGEDGEEEEAGPGFGFVDAYDTSGNLVARVASQGALNAPWGLAIAPAGFGRFSGNLLVGNFGDGRINAYDLATYEPRGHLKSANHKPLVIDGLWGIGFGNGAAAGPTTTLFFAAGPEDETHGSFGAITAINPQ